MNPVSKMTLVVQLFNRECTGWAIVISNELIRHVFIGHVISEGMSPDELTSNITSLIVVTPAASSIFFKFEMKLF